MKKIIGLIIISIVLLSIAGGIAACSPGPKPSTPIDAAAVREYADPMTETTLQGLSENDIEKYMQYFAEKTKEAVTQERFDLTVAQLNAQIGVYVSKEFLFMEQQEGYVVVHYLANYSRGQVGVRMVFDKDQLIAGQWFE
jgi:hypothetical protein